MNALTAKAASCMATEETEELASLYDVLVMSTKGFTALVDLFEKHVVEQGLHAFKRQVKAVSLLM